MYIIILHPLFIFLIFIVIYVYSLVALGIPLFDILSPVMWHTLLGGVESASIILRHHAHNKVIPVQPGLQAKVTQSINTTDCV